MGLITNEFQKIFLQKKIYVFMGMIFGWTLLSSIIHTMGIVNFGITGQALPAFNLRLQGEVLLPVFSIFLIADLITEEIGQGTFKLPLLHSIRREAFLKSKIFALTLLLGFLMAFSMVISYMLGTIFFGWGEHFQLGSHFLTTGEGVLWTFLVHLITLGAIMVFNLFIVGLALIVDGSGTLIGLALSLYLIQLVGSELVSVLKPYVLQTYFGFSQTLLDGVDGRGLITALLVVFIYGLIGYLISKSLMTSLDVTT